MSETEADTYEDAVADGTVTELPAAAVARAVAPPVQQPQPCPTYQQVLDELDRDLYRGRWEDHRPPTVPWTPA